VVKKKRTSHNEELTELQCGGRCPGVCYKKSYRKEKFPHTKNINTKLNLQPFSVELCARVVHFDCQNISQF